MLWPYRKLNLNKKNTNLKELALKKIDIHVSVRG